MTIFVDSLLRKLKFTDSHKILASLPWRQIITTNYDLLIEQAFDAINDSHEKLNSLYPVRALKNYYHQTSNTELKYIKLNGCISDKSQYPLAFSTDDFNKLNKFYKAVLTDLKSLSPEINFLSIGYTFTDSFGKNLLDKFDSYNYREKKWLFRVEPYPNEATFDYYLSKKICLIKCSFEDFFRLYNEWEKANENQLVRKKGISVRDNKGHTVSAPNKLLLNLEGIVSQLDEYSRGRLVKEEEYYRGEEPTYNLIVRNADVKKEKLLKEIEENVMNIISTNEQSFVPIIFISGDFGIGKSTFTLRLINQLVKNEESNIVAFEIQDINNLKKEDIIDLIKTCRSNVVLLYCDDIEIESNFKALIDIQINLSIEQFQECKVILLSPIRENIFLKYKKIRSFKNVHELRINGSFEKEELEELISKLKDKNLVTYRDINERNNLISNIQREYKSDSFLALLASVTGGTHERYLLSCYEQLSKEAKQAFLFTALVHKYKLLMPSGWLKQNISMDWEEFTEKIIKAEGKGILINEIIASNDTNPDLLFRTKHPLIASRLIDLVLKNKDKKYGLYEQMIQRIDYGKANSFLLNDLLRVLSKESEFSSMQINRLYDKAYVNFSNDPYFLLNYAINLQKRNTIDYYKKAIDYLYYAESLLENRNHKFIHRRGVLCSNIAKELFKKDKCASGNVVFYLKEAKELFEVKQNLDPFSFYSYFDYISILIWEINNLDLDIEEILQKRIIIEELFDIANKTVIDNVEKVNSLYPEYFESISTDKNDDDYKKYLDNIINDENLRPYGFILLYNFYLKSKNFKECDNIVAKIEFFQFNNEVVKFLFKVYGRNLHVANYRKKFFELCRNSDYEKDNFLRYNYFRFIAESYNFNFFEGFKYLSKITHKYYHINPEFHNIWKNSEGEIVTFEAKIVKKEKEKFKGIKLLDHQQYFRLIKGNYDKYAIDDRVSVKLHFYLFGLLAEIEE